MLKTLLATTVLAASLVGCSTVTIQPKPIPKLVSSPTYQESKSFYLNGLVGKSTIDTKAVCDGKNVKQMQTQLTFLDGVLTLITLGIYAPHTVKVWCE
jgi:Bor protein